MKITTLTELYDELEKFDWMYQMSDSSQTFRNGLAKQDGLRYWAKQIEGGTDLLQRYEQWRNATLFRQDVHVEKPERP